MKTQNIYDNPDFFDGYKKLRENPDSANVLEENPALFSISPVLTGKWVLDLGCGYGENCEEFKRLGASKVTGVDISEKMLSVAETETTGIEYINADMNDLSEIRGGYDVVFSSLAVHYIADFHKLCSQVSDLLNENGCFIFSQEHPLTTAPIKGSGWSKDGNGDILHYNLCDYGRIGKREVNWIVSGIVKYHRRFSDISNALIEAGFIIEKVLEPLPSDEVIKRIPAYERVWDKPNFLLIRARKGV